VGAVSTGRFAPQDPAQFRCMAVLLVLVMNLIYVLALHAVAYWIFSAAPGVRHGAASTIAGPGEPLIPL